jgi:hypothetical protein
MTCWCSLQTSCRWGITCPLHYHHYGFLYAYSNHGTLAVMCRGGMPKQQQVWLLLQLCSAASASWGPASLRKKRKMSTSAYWSW